MKREQFRSSNPTRRAFLDDFNGFDDLDYQFLSELSAKHWKRLIEKKRSGFYRSFYKTITDIPDDLNKSLAHVRIGSIQMKPAKLYSYSNAYRDSNEYSDAFIERESYLNTADKNQVLKAGMGSGVKESQGGQERAFLKVVTQKLESPTGDVDFDLSESDRAEIFRRHSGIDNVSRSYLCGYKRELVLSVDVNAPDQDIIKNVMAEVERQRALVKKSKEASDDINDSAPKRNFNPDQWIKYRVVQILDVMIWAKSQKLELTNKVIALVVFKDNRNVDGEDVRKYLDRYVYPLFSPERLSRLNYDPSWVK